MLLSNIDISKIKTLSELAPILSVSEKELRLFLNSKESLVRRWTMIKRNDELRKIVSIEDDSFRHLIKRLHAFLYNWYLPNIPQSVHGFVKGRSIVTNAQQHTEKAVVLNVDIKRFFDSITFEKIEQVFLSIGFQKEIAVILARLVTIDNVLATGFSTSPTLSNIVCFAMDNIFQELCKKHNVTYTRYADDITFSSDGYMLSKDSIEIVLNKFDFTINQNKYRLYRRGGPQYVTGLTVVDKRPRLSRRFKRSMRLELYYIKKYGLPGHLQHVFKNQARKKKPLSKLSYIAFQEYGLEGFISYINAIESKLANELSCILLPQKFEE